MNIRELSNVLPCWVSQIREDGKKGVYVENLSEVEVESVQDVVHLLLLVLHLMIGFSLVSAEFDLKGISKSVTILLLVMYSRGQWTGKWLPPTWMERAAGHIAFSHASFKARFGFACPSFARAYSSLQNLLQLLLWFLRPEGSGIWFTCGVMQWECESVTNTRFGRLNLVDLAGSERSIFFDQWSCVLFHSLQEQNDSFFWCYLSAQGLCLRLCIGL